MGAYGARELEFIRTDRNGTKIYHDNNCPRCCGYGQLDKWKYTGQTCWECGGTGMRRKPKVVKVYTEEYQAKLDAKAKARAAAYEAAHPRPSDEELKARALEASRNAWMNEGFSYEGIAYIYTGDTYPHRNVIKKTGGRFRYRVWIAPERIEGLKGVRTTEIKIEGLLNECGYLDSEKFWDLLHDNGLLD